jgi:hypothetical protein
MWGREDQPHSVEKIIQSTLRIIHYTLRISFTKPNISFSAVEKEKLFLSQETGLSSTTKSDS